MSKMGYSIWNPKIIHIGGVWISNPSTSLQKWGVPRIWIGVSCTTMPMARHTGVTARQWFRAHMWPVSMTSLDLAHFLHFLLGLLDCGQMGLTFQTLALFPFQLHSTRSKAYVWNSKKLFDLRCFQVCWKHFWKKGYSFRFED